MSYLLRDTIIQEFTTTWQPPWLGSDRVYAIASFADDGSQFVGCGTDGTTSFRVKGDKATLLDSFRALMQAQGAQELLPEPNNVWIEPTPVEDSISVQDAFDKVYMPQAA